MSPINLEDGGAACPVMGAVFKTVVRARERTQVGSTPTRLRQDQGTVNSE